MKNYIIIIATILLMAVGTPYVKADTQSYTAITPSILIIAEWVADFGSIYDEVGVYQAVANVFEKGKTPQEITAAALDIEGLNPQSLVAALYCAGANSEDIRQTCEEFGISEMILVAGFETAKTVCGDGIADTQAYTRALSAVNFAGVPSGGGGGGTYGSPNTFTK